MVFINLIFSIFIYSFDNILLLCNFSFAHLIKFLFPQLSKVVTTEFFEFQNWLMENMRFNSWHEKSIKFRAGAANVR